jgi:hypothetical protein
MHAGSNIRGVIEFGGQVAALFQPSCTLAAIDLSSKPL